MEPLANTPPATMTLPAFLKTLRVKISRDGAPPAYAPTELAIYGKLLAIRFPRRRMTIGGWHGAIRAVAQESAFVDHMPKPVLDAPRVTNHRLVPRR